MSGINYTTKYVKTAFRKIHTAVYLFVADMFYNTSNSVAIRFFLYSKHKTTIETFLKFVTYSFFNMSLIALSVHKVLITSGASYIVNLYIRRARAIPAYCRNEIQLKSINYINGQIYPCDNILCILLCTTCCVLHSYHTILNCCIN